MHRRMRAIASAAFAAVAVAGIVAGTAGAASAKHTADVTISDNHGILTSGSYLYIGEPLLGTGYAEIAGQQFTVLNLTPYRDIWRVTLSPAPQLGPGQHSADWNFYPGR
jgi:protein-S-isoprenylcysteine O-methyltransferase Ste14